MDICINTDIDCVSLQTFLERIFQTTITLLYKSDNWDSVKPYDDSIEFFECEKVKGIFRYGFNVNMKAVDAKNTIREMAREISKEFHCSAFCDVPNSTEEIHNPYLSLLFEYNKLYLIDDSDVEVIGKIQKITGALTEFETPVLTGVEPVSIITTGVIR
jgi:hypothetical protein